MSNTIEVAQSFLEDDVSLLLEIPLELILLIFDVLSRADALCFALTCKALLETAYKCRKHRDLMHPDSNAKGSFLSRLERDVPWVVYCPWSNKLFPFESNGHVAFKSLEQKGASCRSYLFPMVYPFSSPTITYGQTRLLRNYRLFGPEHGVPLSFLSYEIIGPKTPTSFLQMKCEKYTHRYRRARWVGDNLFLSCTKAFHLKKLGKGPFGQVSIMDLRNVIAKTNALICPHCASEGYGGGQRTVIIPVNCPQIHATLSRDGAYQSTGSCERCETDWDFSISWTDLMDHLVVTYTTYHNLGTCSGPFDEKWKMVATIGYGCQAFLSEPGKLRPDRDPPARSANGDVKRQWMEAV